MESSPSSVGAGVSKSEAGFVGTGFARLGRLSDDCRRGGFDFCRRLAGRSLRLGAHFGLRGLGGDVHIGFRLFGEHSSSEDATPTKANQGGRELRVQFFGRARDAQRRGEGVMVAVLHLFGNDIDANLIRRRAQSPS